MKITLLHRAVRNCNLAVKRRRKPVNDTAFHLRLKSIRIHGHASICRASDVKHARLTLAHIHGHDLSNDRHEAFGDGNTLRLARGECFAPICHFCSRFEHFQMAWFVFKQLTAELIAVHFCIHRELINKALREITMLRMVNRPPWAQPHMCRALGILCFHIWNIVEDRASFRRIHFVNKGTFP